MPRTESQPPWGPRFSRLRLPAQKLALLAAALLAALAAAEGIVRMWVPVRNVGPSFTVYDPHYGQRLKRDFSARRITPEFTMRLTTNALGFRGPQPPPHASEPILFLGDSFTMGYGVDDGEEFPARVDRKLNAGRSEAIPVINAGLGNSGNGWWVKFLRAEGPKLNPRLVIMQIHDNDYADNLRERLFERSATGRLVECPVPPRSLPRTIQSLVERVPGLSQSYLLGLARQTFTPAGRASVRADPSATDDGSDSAEQQLLLLLVQEVLTLCRDHRWPAVAVLVDLGGRRRQEDFLRGLSPG